MKKISIILCYSILLLALSCKEDEDAPMFNLTVSVLGEGTVNTDPDDGTYEAGTTVKLEAVPDANWKFSGWKGDVTGTSPHLQITMDKAVSVSAEFVPDNSYTLDINITAGGTVTADPDLSSYPPGTTVTLTASPSQGYKFDSWGEGITSNELQITVVMDHDVVIAPLFILSTLVNYGYSIDPSNPLILKTFTEEGDVYFYGTKNTNGTIISVDLVSVKTNDFDQPVIISLDDIGRPESIVSPNGDAMELHWSSNTEARVKVVTPAGNRMTFPFDLNEAGGGGGGRIGNAHFEKRSGDVTVSVVPLRDAIHKRSISSNGRNNSSSILSLDLEQCDGAFTDGTVMIVATGTNVPGYQAQYKGISDGNGSFSFNISIPQASNVNSDAVCNSVTSKLSLLCNYVEPLISSGPTAVCSKIAQLFNAGGLPSYEGCETILKSLKLYCSTLGSSPAAGAPVLGAGLCAMPVSTVIPSGFNFAPAVYVEGGEIYMPGHTSTTNASGPFEDILLELPSVQARISSFITDPFDPGPEEGYTATATIVCATAGATAKISIEGTDGYKKNRTTILPAGNSYVTLDVPGSWDGVQDTLTIEVDGIGIVFNVIVF